MSIEEKDKEKDKSIYNYNMIFNKIGNNNSDEDTKFNTDLISDLDLRNFDPKRYEYYTNLLKIYNEDPDTLFNLLNKYNSIKYTKEEEKILIRQIYDYAVKYAKAKKADEDWKKGAQERYAKKATEKAAAGGATRGGDPPGAAAENSFANVVTTHIAVRKAVDKFKGNKERDEPKNRYNRNAY